jgi:hypothetical protein
VTQTLKDFVIERVLPEDYYKSIFPKWNPKVKTNVSCCFHKNDRKPSLSINLRNGGARCFAASCSKSIGNIVHFQATLTSTSEEEAAAFIYDQFIRPIVSVSVVDQYHQTLLTDERAKSTFIRATGLNTATIDNFKIGYSTRAKRYTIPISNKFGQYINIRFYRLKSQRSGNDVTIYSLVDAKDTPNERRHGSIELFSWSNFKTYNPNKPLFFMASEKETMLAIQLGVQAICSTCGEGSFADEWMELLKPFRIGIVFDQDKGGYAATKKLIATLQNARNITLPFPSEYKGDKDFDDWINSKNGNVFGLLRLVEDAFQTTSHPLTPEIQEPNAEGSLATPVLADVGVVPLSVIRTDVSLLNKSIKTRGIIAAVSTKSFDIPWKFKLKVKTGYIDYALPIGRELLSFVGASDTTMLTLLSTYAGSKVTEFKPVNFVPLSEVELIPMAEFTEESESRYTIQRAYAVGLRIESNVPYELTVVPTTLTSTQEKVLIIHDAKETSGVIDTWNLKKAELNELEIFQPTSTETVYEKLEAVADELAANHTKIYSRNDWHIVCLLSWFSPIGWHFPGESSMQRGWLNSLAIGDTQTGKSQVVTTIQRLLKLGDVVNAENCTFVGLVGGAIKTGSGQMMLRWGRIPLCDRKLVIIEELSGLSVEEISNMSEVRSRGIARLDKGGLASQTPARTRLIALSNVRPMRKNLAQYLSGVKAIQELIGHPEDISRFDLIVTLIDSEVSSETINNPKDDTTEATFTPSQLQRLCQFAWSLKPNQIRFSDDAYLQCLDWTKRLQTIYHPSVPIFKAASGRLLLARIAASIATLQFAWDGKVISVESTHVDAAVTFLRGLYDKPSFGYLEYSRQMQDRETIKHTKELQETIKKNIKAEILGNVIESLIHAVKFTRDELQAIADLQSFQADPLIGAMLRSGVIRKGEANTWEITMIGKTWLIALDAN